MPSRACETCSTSITEDAYLISTLQRAQSLCAACLGAQRLELVERRPPKRRAAKAQSPRLLDAELRAKYVSRIAAAGLGVFGPVAIVVACASFAFTRQVVFAVAIGCAVHAVKRIVLRSRRHELAELDDEELRARFQSVRHARKRVLPAKSGLLAALLVLFCALNPSPEDFDEHQPARRGRVEHRDFLVASTYTIDDLRQRKERRFLGLLGQFWELPSSL